MYNDKLIRLLLERKYKLQYRNGDQYYLDVYKIHDIETWKKHISVNKVNPEKISVDIILGDYGDHNLCLGCVNIDNKTLLTSL